MTRSPPAAMSFDRIKSYSDAPAQSASSSEMYLGHPNILAHAQDNWTAVPKCTAADFGPPPRIVLDGSVQSVHSIYAPSDLDSYSQAFDMLHQLTLPEPGTNYYPVIELGALQTATTMLVGSICAGLPAPHMMHHGDDAVVFVWSAGDDDHVFTLTDGEKAYLHRRKGKVVERATEIAARK